MITRGELFPLELDGVFVLPVLHERLEYADYVRLAIADLKPDAIAVELPSSLEDPWLRGVQRLPQISVLLYETAEERTIYLPIQPADPLVEAARQGLEQSIPVHCVDLDVDGYADYRDRVPDSYALVRLGLGTIYDAYRERARTRDPNDARREACMAFHVQAMREAGAERILLVCGMHHAEGFASELDREQAAPLTPPRRKNVRLVHLHPESLGEVLSDIPYYVAAYEARRVDLPALPAQQPAASSAGRTHGPFRVLSGGHGDDPQRIEDGVARTAHQASVDRSCWPVENAAGRAGPLDRLKAQWCLAGEAERALAASAPDEEVTRWQRRLLARYSRNLAALSGRLVVDLYDLLAATRSCVSDNYAWELHRLAVAFPAQAEQATDLPTARIRADELYDGVRRLRLQRRIRRPKRPDWRTLLRSKRRNERRAGEWLEGFTSDAICSYQPEDVRVEEFGRYLKRRGKSLLTEEQSRTLPFTTSILDGIDVRETIRNWHDGKIMVREFGRAPGEVGPVVVIFDEDDEPVERFPYLQTWHGEHDQESDMAFYSTTPEQGVVGPGICRVTYGGFAMSYPPRRVGDVWLDPDYRMAERKSEVLLLAALDYCTEKMVVYVAAKPPRSILHQLAGRLNLKILYVPLGSLSSTTRRKIRVMHLLHGHEKA